MRKAVKARREPYALNQSSGTAGPRLPNFEWIRVVISGLTLQRCYSEDLEQVQMNDTALGESMRLKQTEARKAGDQRKSSDPDAAK